MIDLRDICALTEFQRNAREHVARLRESGRPQVLTVNGRAELVVQSAAAYQALLDRLDEAEALAGIQRGREAAALGDTLPLDEAFSGVREGRARQRA